MVHIPNEIINYILSFREKHPIYKITNYLINKCYLNDYDPYDIHYNRNNYYCKEYSFYEWYFIVVRKRQKYLKQKYFLTPSKIYIGHERLDFEYIYL